MFENKKLIERIYNTITEKNVTLKQTKVINTSEKECTGQKQA